MSKKIKSSGSNGNGMKSSNFLNLVRSKLSERFETLLESNVDAVKRKYDIISQRMFFYMIVALYKSTFGTDVLDVANNDYDKAYASVLKAIKGFCKGIKIVERAKTKSLKYGLYWGFLRKDLCLVAKGRAVAYGCAGNDVIVLHNNRYKFLNAGLIIGICEKETLGKKWLSEMNRRGWSNKVILIVTQGFSACEVIETIMEITDNVNKGSTNIVIGVLHDLDIAGIAIYMDILQYDSNTLDFGITFEMLNAIDSDLWEQIKEPTKVNREQLAYMDNVGLSNIAKKLGKFRLELDNLYANKGIGVFADYTEKVIADNVSIWDLNRISTPYASNPEEYSEMRSEVKGLWDKIVKKVTGSDDWSLDFTGVADERLDELKKENINYKANLDEIKKLNEIIHEQNEELNEIVNEDEDNQDTLKKLKEVVDMLDLPKLYETLNEYELEDSE